MKTSHVAFFLLGFVTFESLLIGFVDRPLSEYLRSVDAQHPEYINMFRSYTDIGKSKWYLILSGLGFVMSALALRLTSLKASMREKIARIGIGLFFFFVSIAASGIVADIIKPIVGRARPVMLDREGFYGFHPLTFQASWNSMPSGHTVTAFTIAGVLSFFFPRGQTFWLLFAAAIAVSRIMVNAHFLSDVFAGAGVGLFTVILLRYVFRHNVANHLIWGIFPIDRKNTLGKSEH